MIEQSTRTAPRAANGNGNGASSYGAPFAEPATAGVIGHAPPSVGVVESVKRYPLLVIIPALALMILGIVVGLQKQATYVADARLTVGRINLNAPGALAGYASATQALASQFARAATATPVVAPVAKKLDIPESRVRSRVSASPIPESPIFTVRATARTEAGAIAMANATAVSVQEYARKLNDRDPDSGALLGRYKETSDILAAREARADALKERFEEKPSAGLRRKLADARASRNFWRLREQAIEERYLAATGGEASSRLIEILNQAETAKSDRRRWIQILGFAGLLGGVLLGMGLATFVANRRVRRRLAAST